MKDYIRHLKINSIYDFDDCLSINELLCKFYEKIEDTIEVSNEAIDILNWVRETGVGEEVQRLVQALVDNGDIERMINVDKFEEFKTTVNNAVDTIVTAHNVDIERIDNLIDEVENSLSQDIVNFKEDVQSQIDDLESGLENTIDSMSMELDGRFNSLSSSIDEKLSTIKYVRNQAELKTALTSGSIIYIISSMNLTEVMKVPSNVKIIGKGNVTLTTNQNAIFIPAMTTVTGYNGNYNIHLENITFDGLDRDSEALTLVAFAHGKNITIRNCYFKNLHIWHMIEINGCKDVIIDNCTFDNYGNSGTQGTEAVQLDAMINQDVYPWSGSYDNTVCDNVTIQNCVFTNIGNAVMCEDRIKCIGNHTFNAGARGRNIKILNNKFYNVNFAIHLCDVFSLIVTNNVCENSHTFFRMETASNSCENVIIAHNTYIGLKNATDVLNDGRFVMIQHQGNLTGAIVDNVTIVGNVIYNATGHGIGFTANNVRVTSNFIRTTGRNGIYAFGGSNIIIGDNTVSQSGTGYYGIKIGANPATETYCTLVHGNLADINIEGNSRHTIVSDNIGTITNNNGAHVNDNF